MTLRTALAAALDAAGVRPAPAPDAFSLQPTRKEFAGTYTFVTFPYAKAAATSPDGLAQRLGEHVAANCPAVAGFNVVKGFLNLEISDAEWVRQLSTLVSGDHETNRAQGATAERVVVEYSSPNTNKPLHFGHLRNNFLGYAVAEILKENGAIVTKANLINDRGIHICKSMIAYQRFGHGETPQSSGQKGDHLVGHYYVLFNKHYREEVLQLQNEGLSEEVAKKRAPLLTGAQELLLKWEEGDAETVDLWRTMNSWVYAGFDATYQSIGVDFDKFYYESETYLLGKERVEEGLRKGVFFRKPDNSVWIDLTAEGLDEKLVLRADGTSVYITQDLGTAELKYQETGCRRSVYVIGDEQNYHMQVLQAILRRLEKPYADGIHHLSYGMVDLPSGRMKSREGNVVDADVMVAEMIATARATTQELGKIDGLNADEAEALFRTLGLGALKFFLLKVEPKKRMLFNPEESIDFRGHTGPFVQYTHARSRSISRKAAEQGLAGGGGDFADVVDTLNDSERELIAHLIGYRAAVRAAATALAPSLMAQYAYELAKASNRFLAESPVLSETDPARRALRLALVAQVATTLHRALKLLGIDAPDRM
ncbi:MAG: arginine--tRNA ligase [Hymenobacteraceae bacterium]|nr:arginine--tRNA ligase [Hymenobacteraceae bacterium]